MATRLRRITTLAGIDKHAWNALARDNPFLKHEFLIALERSGCVGGRTNWQPTHLLVEDAAGRLLGALPLYLKYDSRGEFVFDWGWADAYERSGRAYYPKLVSSVPFTPATGERVLVAPGADESAIATCLLGAARELAAQIGASSLHVLFPVDAQRPLLERAGLVARKSCQFHWHNRGYASFDEFLSTFASAKRKKARRERRRVEEAQIGFEHLAGDEPTRAEWDAIYEFHASTFRRRGRRPYLNRAFFDEIAKTMPQHLLIVLARHRGAPIATAICLHGGGTLYGRYWGSLADFHSLHFEACYYQGIEFCIRAGLARFEPGTQGEHKISRGFTPAATWSYHWLTDPVFHEAVADFVEREAAHVDAYMTTLNGHVPYRRTENAPAA
jgi:predicted N-acyltransferase